MRRSLRPSTVLKLGASASLVLVAVWALTPSLGAGASHRSAPAAREDAVAGRTGAGGPATRRWHVTLAPAPDDLALAQVSFVRSNGVRLSEHSLRVAVAAPFGDDYLAAAAYRPAAAAERALVLLVNRPSPLLDPVSVRVSLTAWRSLGEPAVRTLADAFARKAGAAKPALCDLRLHGAPLTGSDVSVLGSHGAPLAGFAAAEAVAQAYDVVCGLAYSSAFAQAVEQTSPASPSPVPSEPSPVPSPTPPVGRLPGEGCEPTPGTACPAAVRSAYPAVRGTGAPRTATGAH